MPSRSPIVMRMKRCSIDARVRRAARLISCAAMPYTVSVMLCHSLFAADSFSSSVMSVSYSYAVQVMLVVAAQLALAQHVALPGLDLRHDVGQEPQAVVRRQDRHAEHVAEHAEHEQRLHRGGDLQGPL